MRWSWVPTVEDVDERCQHARRLAGLTLSAVRYVMMDYGLIDRPPGMEGPRPIEREAELAEPSWRCETFDWADHAVEFETASGQVFTVSWDSPGPHEGIWIREMAASGSAHAEGADVAVWDVTGTSRWRDHLGEETTDVVMHYRPWPTDDGYWCSRITVHFASAAVHLLLGEEKGDGQFRHAATSVAVLFPPTPLPDWEERGD